MTLENQIGYEFQNSELLKKALTHKSYYNENSKNVVGHNECLEFLGDAVLDLSVSALLMRVHPQLTEGELSKVRASLVNEGTLAGVAVELGFSKHLLLGKGEAQSGGAEKPRLLASAFEAFVGAFFQDAGFDRVDQYLVSIFGNQVENLNLDVHFASDYKTRLQEKVQEVYRQTPHYNLTREEGPDHEKVFYVEVKVGEKVLAEGKGRNKKQAEQEAAKLALESML